MAIMEKGYKIEQRAKIKGFEEFPTLYEVFKHCFEGADWVSTQPITTIEGISIEKWTSVFVGTLPECEAWINLHEKGYM